MTDDADLTVKQALALLPSGRGKVHAIIPCGPILTGADWGRKEVTALIRSSALRKLTGPNASGMGHGLAVWRAAEDIGPDSGFWVYFATKPARAGQGDTV